MCTDLTMAGIIDLSSPFLSCTVPYRDVNIILCVTNVYRTLFVCTHMYICMLTLLGEYDHRTFIFFAV